MSTEVHYENGTLTVTRTFDAPREAVFEAWIETSKVEKWWGCSMTTSVKSEIEPKVGGKYNHLMTIEGVGDYPMVCKITAYEPPELFAYEDVSPNAANSEGAGPMRVTVSFISHGSQTEVRLVHENLPENFSEMVKGGWTAAFGKLHDLLLSETAGA